MDTILVHTSAFDEESGEYLMVRRCNMSVLVDAVPPCKRLELQLKELLVPRKLPFYLLFICVPMVVLSVAAALAVVLVLGSKEPEPISDVEVPELPSKEEDPQTGQPEKPAEDSRSTPFYNTWIFWTILGIVALSGFALFICTCRNVSGCNALWKEPMQTMTYSRIFDLVQQAFFHRDRKGAAAVHNPPRSEMPS
jgi:hypothetical protein